MKKLISLSSAALALSLCFTAAHAAEDKAPTKQQSKMTTCNAEAKGKKGDERKTFMKECLSTSKQETQQNKMTTCNADAKTKALKGDERKAFMKGCLSNKPAA